MSKKITDLLIIVDLELQKAQKYYEVTKDSAHEIAKTALTSHSQAGDRFHSQGAMEISRERLNGILKLKEELEKVKDRNELTSIDTPCYVKTDKTDFYLVKNVVLISGVRLVSESSEIGKELKNKKVGDTVNDFVILEIQ